MIQKIGTDIVEMRRISQVFESQGDAFIERICSDEEILLLKDRKNAVEFLAGRWAAKEAVIKVLKDKTGFGGILWEISIEHDPAGAPIVNLSGKTREKAKKQKLKKIHVSISHSRDYAIAFAIGER